MRMLPELFTGNWEDMFQGLLEGEQEVDVPDAPEIPEVSLHDLFDVEVDAPEEDDANQEAVDGMFPEWMLSESEGTDGGDSGVCDLEEVMLDLKCYEEGLPPSDSEPDEAEEGGEEAVVPTYVKIKEEASELVLDCPENPGHGCRACDFHRGTSGNPEALCALCYMRLTVYCIYSKCLSSSNKVGEVVCTQ